MEMYANNPVSPDLYGMFSGCLQVGVRRKMDGIPLSVGHSILSVDHYTKDSYPRSGYVYEKKQLLPNSSCV